MNENPMSRRTLLRGAILMTPLAAFASPPPHYLLFPRLQPEEAVARRLLYVEDTREVPRDHPLAKRHSPEQKCANCVQLRGEDGEPWRPCPAFPGRVVSAEGWCTIWAGA